MKITVFRLETKNINYWKNDEAKTVGSTYNYFFGFYLDEKSQFTKMMNDLLSFDEINPQKNTLSDIHKFIKNNDYLKFVDFFERTKKHNIYKNNPIFIDKEFGQLIRELTLESIRLDKYPAYPSRQTCLYCIPDEKGISYWKNRINSKSKDYQLVELEIEGDTFVGNDDFLIRYEGDIETYKENLINYWDIEGSVKMIESEILFNGTARCIRVIEENNMTSNSES